MCCFDGTCPRCRNEQPLAPWERELLNGRATVVFTRTDGRTVTLTDVNPDSIGPSAENKGVIGVEFNDDSDRVVHLPFVESWEITYS